MKFTELSLEKQELVTAYINGCTIQIKDTEGEWCDACDSLYSISMYNTRILRVKPKEPKVTCLYTGVDKTGGTYFKFESNNVDAVNDYYENTEFVGYLKKTFHDDKFISIEFIPVDLESFL